MSTVTASGSSKGKSVTKLETSQSYSGLASQKPVGALSPRSVESSSKVSELTSPSPRTTDILHKSLEFSPNSAVKSTSILDFKTKGAIIDTPNSPKMTQSSKHSQSEKNKLSLSTVSESLRRDAKFPSGRQNHSDDVFLESKQSVSEDDAGII